MKRLGATISGAAANLAAQGIPFLLLLIVTPILLKALGRQQYGVLVLFNLVPQIAGQLDLGLSTAAMRGFTQHCARDDERAARRLFREASSLLLAWGIVLGAAFYLGHRFVAQALKLDTVVADDSWIYVAAAVAIPLALANSAVLIPLRALERYGSVARIQVLTGTAYWTVCAWWAPRGSTLTDLVILGTTTVAISTVAMYFIGRGRAPEREAVRRADPAAPDGPDLGGSALHDRAMMPAGASIGHGTWLLPPFLGLGAGAFIAQASSLATFHADKLLVSALISPAAAGAYAICTSIANKILLVISSGATFTFPRTSRLHAEGNHEGIAETYAFSTRICVLIGACLATPLIALAYQFLSIWIGPAFSADYAAALQILTFGYAMTTSSVVASNVAVGLGRAALPASFAFLSGVMTIASVAILAPRYGAVGAAMGAAFGMSQSVLFNAIVARRLGARAQSSSWALLARILVVAVPVGLVTSFAGALATGWFSLFGLGAVSAAAFGAIWLSTFGRTEELAMISQLRKRLHRPNERFR